jgi:hypothetical protein
MNELVGIRNVTMFLFSLFTLLLNKRRDFSYAKYHCFYFEELVLKVETFEHVNFDLHHTIVVLNTYLYGFVLRNITHCMMNDIFQ